MPSVLVCNGTLVSEDCVLWPAFWILAHSATGDTLEGRESGVGAAIPQHSQATLWQWLCLSTLGHISRQVASSCRDLRPHQYPPHGVLPMWIVMASVVTKPCCLASLLPFTLAQLASQVPFIAPSSSDLMECVPCPTGTSVWLDGEKGLFMQGPRGM